MREWVHVFCVDNTDGDVVVAEMKSFLYSFGIFLLLLFCFGSSNPTVTNYKSVAYTQEALPLEDDDKFFLFECLCVCWK